jgi:primosomal protein N' (replication factor Y)
VLGPLPTEPGPPGHVRALLRAPLDDGPALSAALRATQAGRSARKAADFVTVRVDPVALG